MKARLFTLLIALLAIVTGAKAQKIDPIVVPNTLELELYSGEEIPEVGIKLLVLFAEKAGLIVRQDGQGGATFYKGKKELFSIKVRDTEGKVIVPTDVTWEQNPDPVRVTQAELQELGITGDYSRMSVVFSVTINSINFTDATFRTYVSENFDTNLKNKGRLTKAEAEAVTEINVSEKGITSLKGVEYFTKLAKLYCSRNQLTSLNVSGCTALTSLNCYNNQLTTLDVSGLTKLQTLTVGDDYLTTLDMSGCTALNSFYYTMGDVNPITTIKASGCTSLKYFNCYNTQLKELDVSGCTSLIQLNCWNNKLISLNVSGCTTMESLDCSPNQLTSLDVSGCTALKNLYCDMNQLTSLDVSGCTSLSSLSCEENQLTSLDVSGCTALKSLVCYRNQLTTLNVSGCTALTGFSFYSNSPLTSLDASGCVSLESLSCNNNGIDQLTTLNVSGCTSLNKLYCFDLQLTKLDVSGCTSLDYLNCNNNQLSTIDVSTNTALEYLYCRNNQLTTIDVSNNSALTGINCTQNLIRGAGMAALVSSLPGDKSDAFIRVYDARNSPEGNVITRIQAQIVREEKGWELLKYDEAAEMWVDYLGESVPADANGDGEVTAADVEAISDHILCREAPDRWFDEESADVVDDGVVDIQDLTQLIKLLTEE